MIVVLYFQSLTYAEKNLHEFKSLKGMNCHKKMRMTCICEFLIDKYNQQDEEHIMQRLQHDDP